METSAMDQRIVEFINKHHLLTLTTSASNQPWAASCFYAWSGSEQAFIITSDLSTRHGGEAALNPVVAGAIAWETKLIGRIQGIQFTGKMTACEGKSLDFARKAYMKRFPIARLLETHLWLIKPVYIKMTHNQLGFGTKLIWERPPTS